MPPNAPTAADQPRDEATEPLPAGDLQPWAHVTAAVCRECDWTQGWRTYRSKRRQHRRAAEKALGQHWLRSGHRTGDTFAGSAGVLLTYTRTLRGSPPAAETAGLPTTGR